jgi:hypothetical protein
VIVYQLTQFRTTSMHVQCMQLNWESHSPYPNRVHKCPSNPCSHDGPVIYNNIKILTTKIVDHVSEVQGISLACGSVLNTVQTRLRSCNLVESTPASQYRSSGLGA